MPRTEGDKAEGPGECGGCFIFVLINDRTHPTVGRIHRVGGNNKRLEKEGANTDHNNGGDQCDLQIVTPKGFRVDFTTDLAQERIETSHTCRERL